MDTTDWDPTMEKRRSMPPSQYSAAVERASALPMAPADCAINGVPAVGGAQQQSNLSRVKSLDSCRVCGDGPARMHYGVPTCFGCKGFFRRTLKRTKEYSCRYSGNCVVDRYERNSCRFCRFKRCLGVGMDPNAVRPDRDAAGRTHPVRRRMPRNVLLGETTANDVTGGDRQKQEIGDSGASSSDEWVRKLPVEMRTLLMQVMNMEVMVAHGDTHQSPKQLYPLPFQSLRQMLEDPSCLDGRRTEIRYEPYRQVEPDELTCLAHRRLVATVDFVDQLCALMDLHNSRDKVALVKATFAPLTLFCAVAATSRVTRNRDILCLCNFGYVPRGAHLSYEEPYHFANRLVDRTLDELVEPFRTFNFKEQEVVLMKAILALNPYLSTLSTEAAEQVADFRDRVQETLYNVVRESHPKEVASSRFGNLLLFLPSIQTLSSIMLENLQFIQSFHHQDIGPLLGELLEEELESDYQIPLDELQSPTSSGDEHSLQHSQSASSISSMASMGQGQLLDQQPFWTQQQIQQSTVGVRRATMPNLSEQVLRTQLQPSGSSAGPLCCSADSDPDYNVTLTAESLRRQAIQQQMEVDSPPSDQQPNIPSSLPEPFTGGQRPQFFIECPTGRTAGTATQQQQQKASKAMVAATKHVFTVERPAGLPPCCRASGPGLDCSNEQCPTALAAIFRQQPLPEESGACFPFDSDTRANGIGPNAAQKNVATADPFGVPLASVTAISKSQSYPVADGFSRKSSDIGELSTSFSDGHFRH